MEWNRLNLTEIAAKIAKREVSSVEVTKACLKQIERQKAVNALNTVCTDSALAAAERADKKIAAGDKVSPIAGVPIVVKDNIVTEGIKTTCSSKMLANFIPPYNATVVEKLLASDAVIIGKANMDEFAMGSSNETSHFGNVLNPVDHERVPGGSSGGSAASVAACEAYAALGSDTGGSIRQPSALCGVVGLKPTYGLVSRYGLIAFASSLDQIGPITRSAKDCAAMLNILAGHDDKDSTSADLAPVDYSAGITDSIKGMRVGIAKEFFGAGLNAEVKKSVMDAVGFYEKNGAEVVDISIPYMEELISVYYVISSAEAASNLARFDGVKYGFRAEKFTDIVDLYVRSRTEGFGEEVKRRIMLGNYVLSSGYYDAYYLKALKVRTLVKNSFAEAFGKCDIMAAPTSPCTAFKFGEKCGDCIQMYLSDVYTVSSNIAGNPAISIPCGKDQNGLPIGLQMIAKPFEESTLLRAANFFESNGGAKWITK